VFGLTKQLPLEFDTVVIMRLFSADVTMSVVVDGVDVIVEIKLLCLAEILKKRTTKITPTRIKATINNLMDLESILLLKRFSDSFK
jgi:hypothetical protein